MCQFSSSMNQVTLCKTLQHSNCMTTWSKIKLQLIQLCFFQCHQAFSMYSKTRNATLFSKSHPKSIGLLLPYELECIKYEPVCLSHIPIILICRLSVSVSCTSNTVLSSLWTESYIIQYEGSVFWMMHVMLLKKKQHPEWFLEFCWISHMWLMKAKMKVSWVDCKCFCREKSPK